MYHHNTWIYNNFKDFSSETEPVQLSVREPVGFSPNPFTSYTSFAIYIQTSHPAFSAPRSATRRRFSEFRWLRSLLWRHHPHRTPPVLPPSGVLVWNKFDDVFLEVRRAGLQRFLREVVCVPAYLGERALHFFLQTELSIRDIEANLSGQRDDNVSAHCSYWPAAPKGQESQVEVTSPRDIESSKSSRDLSVTSYSITSDASSNGELWSPPSSKSNWLPPPASPSTGLGTSLIC